MSTPEGTSAPGEPGPDQCTDPNAVAPKKAEPKKAQDCDDFQPSDKWTLTTHSQIGGGAGVGVTGVIGTLKDNIGGCEHHISFSGIGPAAGGKARGKELPISFDGPGGEDFTTQVPIKAKGFQGGGRLVTASATLGPGWEIGRAQFGTIKTNPEWLDIGGLEFGAGLSAGAYVGYWWVS